MLLSAVVASDLESEGRSLSVGGEDGGVDREERTADTKEDIV